MRCEYHALVVVGGCCGQRILTPIIVISSRIVPISVFTIAGFFGERESRPSLPPGGTSRIVLVIALVIFCIVPVIRISHVTVLVFVNAAFAMDFFLFISSVTLFCVAIIGILLTRMWLFGR